MRDECHSELYQKHEPYPEVKVMGPNAYYATLLKEDYTGLVSEFTAISQYIYHSFMIETIDKEISKMLQCIAIVEMHHLKILAELITLLGGNPIYYSQNSFWNGTYVDYGCNLLEQLKSDLEAEYEAIYNYRQHIELIKDPYIQTILKRIVEDEEMHVQLFKSMIAKVEQYKIQ